MKRKEKEGKKEQEKGVIMKIKEGRDVQYGFQIFEVITREVTVKSNKIRSDVQYSYLIINPTIAKIIV